MKQLPAHEILERVFNVIVHEARKNPTLAKELIAAIGARQLSSGKPPPQRAERRAFDAAEFHAVNILRLHGEGVLRGKLEEVRAIEDLRSIAKASGLVLSGSACKARPSRADLISAILSAAKHYDAQRSAAVS